ncbi:hypothetical protein [uncultured Lamprocystis sp.]|jgi:hypothetical protein|uniref:hypothetical protein n=1 Tax=uncultured Lamprocystis sp. TaxID=543132 RepID=UPI0025D27657|nr:hypothetical protein [uncultured Lamprocystis sp.]
MFSKVLESKVTIVVTCGYPGSRYEEVHGLFTASGLSETTPSRREGLTVGWFHEQALKAHGVSPQDDEAVLQLAPGRLWEELAIDLVLGNLQKENWGWADWRSLWLLEFWRDFDPQIRFVLVYQSLDVLVAELVQSGATMSAQDLLQITRLWLSIHRELVRFHHRNRGRSILVNGDRVFQAPELFVAKASDCLQLPLHWPAAADIPAPGAPSALARLLVKSLPWVEGDVSTLWGELEAVAEFGSDEQESEHPSVEHAVTEFQGLVAALNRAESRFTIVTMENDALQQARTEHDRLVDELNSQLSAVRSAQAAAEAAVETERAAKVEHVKENEQLLVHLHQVQEELERYFYKDQGDALQQAQVEHGRLVDELNSRLNAARSAQSAAEKSEAAAKNRVDKAEAVNRSEAQARQQEQIKHQQLIDDLKRQLTTARNAQAAAEAAVSKERAAKVEQAKECDLLLAQLHQVQEELESYFLQDQARGGNALLASALPPGNADAWNPLRPVEWLLDLREEIVGENWYYAEHDGRWAGPEARSSLELPALPRGRYQIRFDIVDTMQPEILAGLTAVLNGTRLDLEPIKAELPALVIALYDAGDAPTEGQWRLELLFPGLVSPAERGSEDERRLAIRLRTVRIIAVDEKAQQEQIPPLGEGKKRKRRWWNRG